MLLDNNAIYSDKQAVAGGPGDIVSANSLDQVVGGDALHNALWLVVSMATAAASSGSATLQARLETADDAAFATNKTVLWQSGAVALASLKAGYAIGKLRLPIGMRRYSRVVYSVGTAALTGGSVNAFLTPAVDLSL